MQHKVVKIEQERKTESDSEETKNKLERVSSDMSPLKNK